MKPFLATLVFAAASTGFAAADVAWGTAADGLRLGIGLSEPSSDPMLRLLFQNVASSEQDLLLGGETGKGTLYAIKFAATAPDGKEFEVFYVGGAGAVAGHLGPALVRIKPGGTQELLLPLKKFMHFDYRKNIMLEDLLRQRYSVRASLEVSAESASWSRASHAWIGKMTSAEFFSRQR